MEEKQIKSQARIEKEEKVAKLAEKFAQAKTLIFWDYAGLTVAQIQQLRSQLAPLGSKVTVAKNTLINLALKNSAFRIQDSGLLEGPTAILTAVDEINSLKALFNFIQSTRVGGIKFGFLNQRLVDKEQLEYLATFPSKEAVFGQIVNTLNSPIYAFLGVLQEIPKTLVSTLSVVKQKGGEVHG